MKTARNKYKKGRHSVELKCTDHEATTHPERTARDKKIVTKIHAGCKK